MNEIHDDDDLEKYRITRGVKKGASEMLGRFLGGKGNRNSIESHKT